MAAKGVQPNLTNHYFVPITIRVLCDVMCTLLCYKKRLLCYKKITYYDELWTSLLLAWYQT